MARRRRVAGLRFPLRGDDGMALAIVALLGSALLVIGMIVVARATVSQMHTAADRDYEDALFVAESGVDVALIDVADDWEYATVGEGTDLSSKAGCRRGCG
jgi:hypothetical protein